MSETDEKTIIDWYSMLRDACLSGLMRNPIVLGNGVNSSIVEIDESPIGEKKGNTIAEPVIKNICF